MGLSSGAKLGPYEIVSPLGAGGMGEVYRARDTKLNRDVALKVLPEALSHDTERMARFKREAQVLASLNHPNIAVIHGFEEAEGVRALVMELVEGQTLAEMVAARRAVPLPEALPMAKQIADALEYAHERGIIHRDLKPANVKVTPEGTVKVLDFGLAKALDVDPASSSSNVSNSPTLTVAATQAGVIIGTAAYMSPEQARGKAADRRSDIWSFGCVLYEMLSGKWTFEGDTVSDTLAAVLKTEPDWDAIPPETPPAIQKLIRRCLVKDPKQRIQAIGDARIAIEEGISGVGPADESPAPAGGASPRPQSSLRRTLPWAAGIVVGAAVATLVTLSLSTGVFRKSKPPIGAVRFEFTPPEGYTVSGPTFLQEEAVSPDGRMIAFVATESKGREDWLWVRALDGTAAQRLDDTSGAFGPFWSPDSKFIGYAAGGKLMRIPVTGGSPQTICATDDYLLGTWGPGSVILFGRRNGPVMKVSTEGGEPSAVTEPDAKKSQFDIGPDFLPDGRHFLFLRHTSSVTDQPNAVYVGSLDSHEVKLSAKIPSIARFCPPNHLLFVRDNVLMAQAFEPGRLELSGDPIRVADGVGSFNLGLASFSVSSNGVLAFRGGYADVLPTSQLVWYSRDGKRLGEVGEPGFYGQAVLSPDEKHVALKVSTNPRADVSIGDIWLLNLGNGVFSRLTFNNDNDVDPVWSPDSREITYAVRTADKSQLMQLALGSNQPRKLFAGSLAQDLDDRSPDGKFLAYHDSNHTTFFALPMAGEQKPIKLLEDRFFKEQLHFSPDGKWVAYSSNESGRTEIYVASFPKMEQKHQVSTDGGGEPMWRGDGRELYYLSLDGKMMAVSVMEGSTIETGTPKALFPADPINPFGNYDITAYNVTRDGKKFLLLEPVKNRQTEREPIHVIVNWEAALSQIGRKAPDSN